MRRSWRVTAALALLLASASILLSAWLYAKIQDERERTIRTSCVATNERHDRTIATLNQLIAELPPGPRRKRAVEGRTGTVLLIDALAPKRDCAAYVAKQVRTP